MTDPTSRQRGRPTKYRTTTFRYIPSNGKQHLVTSPILGSTPRLTDWQTVNRKITLNFDFDFLPESVTQQLYSWNMKRELSTSPLPADCYSPSVVSRPTQTFSARARVSRLALQCVRSNDWTSQGQRGHSVRVRDTASTETTALFILSRTTADLSR
jgi:hypothetical protein